MSKEFKITKEKVLAMAEECEEAKAVLKKGFPEVFEEEWIDVTSDFEFHPYKVGSFYWIGIYPRGASLHIGWIDSAGAHICTHQKKSFKVDKIEERLERFHSFRDNYFRILRRQ